MPRPPRPRRPQPLFTAGILDDPALAQRGVPLRELMARVVAWYEQRRDPETTQTMRLVARLLEEAGMPDHPTPHHVATWVTWMERACGYSQGTVYLRWRFLVRAFNVGQKLSISAGNPAWVLQLPQPASRPHHVAGLIADLWPRWLAACAPGEWGARERGFLWVLRCTGCRKGEALALAKEDVLTTPSAVAPHGELFIRRQREAGNWTTRLPKGKRARRIPMTAELARELAAVVALGPAAVRIGHGGQADGYSPFLFPFHGRHLVDLGRRLREVTPGAFPEGRMWHVLRHTMAAALDGGGADLGVIARVLGHASTKVTRSVYLGDIADRPQPGTLAAIEAGHEDIRARPKRAPPRGRKAEERLRDEAVLLSDNAATLQGNRSPRQKNGSEAKGSNRGPSRRR